MAKWKIAGLIALMIQSCASAWYFAIYLPRFNEERLAFERERYQADVAQRNLERYRTSTVPPPRIHKPTLDPRIGNITINGKPFVPGK